MKLSGKIIQLRKRSGMSQEDLAARLDVSRQAISRWESGSAMPDANNILQLSKLFSITTDYLLHDEYQSDYDLPSVKVVENDKIRLILICMVALECMVCVLQFMSVFVLQNEFFALLNFLPFIALLGGFEYAYHRNVSNVTEKSRKFRRTFYQISAWLGLYFPVRFVVSIVARYYPRPYSTVLLEGIVFLIYVMIALILHFLIGKKNKSHDGLFMNH